MSSFQTLINSFDSENSKRGKQFERFVKWFLVHDPEWSTRVDKVWLWDDWPENWGRDCGIDLIFKEKNTGEIWAVQAKCYDPNYAITKKDVDSFLSESSRPQIDKRLLIATTDIIGPNASKVCNETDKQVVRYLLHNFEESAIEYPKTLSDIASAKVKVLPKPRKYQLKAIEDVMNGFSHSDRGQLIMACGTGKTLTTLWIKEKLKSKTTLVLLPSLNLVSQTLKEWTAKKNTDFSVLCVCSDANIGKTQYDEIIGKIEDLSFPSTSDSNEILKFLDYSGDKVIFSTYQSSPLVAEAQKKSSVQFDLVVADEAHRCTGELNKPFTTVLDQSKIKAHKRLFTTATPRTYSANLKKRANERGIEVSGMDNESLFGSVFHTLNFASAINNKPQLLTDYQVVIVGVDQPMIAQWIKDRELLRTSKGEATNAKDLAAQLGLIKAIKDYDLNRLISFHSRVKKAGNFSVEIQDAIDIVDDGYKPKGSIWSDYVSGEMTTRSRNTKLKQLKELSNCQIGILSNARCLSEGVDVPSLDGVAFIDPKSSQVDIIQAVGRAIRLSDHKTIGTIVLPVFIEQDDDEIDSIESSNFKPIWDVINALRSHDEELSLELDQLRTQMGLEGTSEVRNISDKIIFDIPVTVDASFSRSLKTKIVEKTSASWDFMFGLLKKHISVYGNSLPSGKEKFEGYNLEGWVSRQRVYKKQNELSIDRIQKLESLKEWVWDVLEYQWDEWLKDIKVYIEKYGSKLPSSSSITNKKDKYLIRRIQTIRKTYRENKLSIKKIKQAETIKGWSWDPVQDSWNELIQRIKAYIVEHKNSHISSTHKTSDGYTLGNRIYSLRNKYKKNKLDTEKISELESIEGWTWDPDADNWAEFVFNLKKYQKINKGNALTVSVSHQIDGYPLGKKISFYRKKYRENSLTNNQIKEIESVHGWSWEPMKEVFPTFIEQLKIFIKKYGHARVHQNYYKDGYALGIKVSGYRVKYNKGKLTKVEIQQLDSIKEWSWDPVADAIAKSIDEILSHIQDYFVENGHARIPHQPSGFKSNDGFPLGVGASEIRRKYKEKLSPKNIKQLESYPGWTWDPIQQDWNDAVEYLIDFFKNNHGKQLPPHSKTKYGYDVSDWSTRIRRKYKDNKLSKEEINQFESINGWSWDPKLDQKIERWNEFIYYLERYVAQKGDSVVPSTFKFSEYHLGDKVSKVRRRYFQNNLSDKEIAQLEAIPGWVWSINKQQD